MRKIFTVFLVVFSLLISAVPVCAADVPEVYSDAAIVMDANTGQVLYNKNMHTPMYPASLTKILTCLIAMEDGTFSDTITVTQEMTDLIPGATNISLEEGEQVNFGDMAYVMMVESANDAANAIALHIGGSFEEFAELMNARARKAGALNSTFLNPSGLPEDDHITTAYDLAMITKAAFAYPEFRSLAGTQKYTVPPTNKEPKERTVNNLQYMFNGSDVYPGAFAGKTGWTEEAGHTLMTLAERDGRTLICIVMKAHGVVDAQFVDSTNLLDYGFQQFEKVDISRETVSRVLSGYIDAQEQGVERASVQHMPDIYLPVGMSADTISFEVTPATIGASTTDLKLQLSASGLPSWIPSNVGEIPISLQLAPVADDGTAQSVSLWTMLLENPLLSKLNPLVVFAILAAVLLIVLLRTISTRRYKKRLAADHQRLQEQQNARRRDYNTLDVRYTKPKNRR